MTEAAYSMMTARLVRPIQVAHVAPEGRTSKSDVAATEEPLQIRLEGEPFAVIMRTPGLDRHLAAGFLLAERVIRDPGELGAIEHHPERPNVLEVGLAPSRAGDLASLLEGRRQVLTNSSCGLCGRLTIESLATDGAAITAGWTIPARLVAAIPERLRAAQEVFDETGGLHAAGLFDRSGRLEAHAEDVGRHNAVDKVIGHMLLAGRLPLADSMLFVSGRTSYEIVQKAFLAGVPIVGAVSAPSSLAIELAEEVGITLLGFVRGETFNVYAHGWRITD